MKNFIFVILTLCGLMTLSLHAYAEASQSTTYQTIKAMQKSGKTQEAKDSAVKYLQNNPKDVDVMLVLAQIYYHERSYPQARELSTKIIEYTPKYEDARLVLINTELATQNYQKALDQAKAGLQLDPQSKNLKDAEQRIQNKMKAGSETSPTTKPEKKSGVDYKYIKNVFDDGDVLTAKKLSQNYLRKYPYDDDVRILLARIYVKEKNWLLAETEFIGILAHNPKNVDARIALVNIYVENRQNQLALFVIDDGLKYLPCDSQLLTKKAVMFYLAEKFYCAAALGKQALRADPCNKEAAKLLYGITQTNPRYLIGPNEITFYSQNDRVSDLKQWWDYSSIQYALDTGYGIVAARLNYANRNHHQALQKEIEAAPILSRYLYLDLVAGYAHNPNLFPDVKLAGEAYISLPNLFDFSIGDKYAKISSTYFNAYTGSIAKTINNFWFCFRPYHFVPKIGAQSTLYTATARRYFCDPDTFVSLTLGAGRQPDLADLLTVNFIVLRNKLINLDWQFPICQHKVVMKLGAEFEHQVFINTGHIRNIAGGNIGIKYRF